jgi:putative acetyltransferase
MEIRDERAGEHEAIRRVHLEAFGGDLEARLVELLRKRGKSVTSLVALEGPTVVGHVLFSPVTIEGSDGRRGLGLAPVGVLPQFQRGGIGSALIREGLLRCRRDDYDMVVLVGAPAYYGRFGFQAAKNFGLDNEFGVNDEFMVLELSPGSLRGIRGLVRYAPEFSEVFGSAKQNG